MLFVSYILFVGILALVLMKFDVTFTLIIRFVLSPLVAYMCGRVPLSITILISDIFKIGEINKVLPIFIYFIITIIYSLFTWSAFEKLIMDNVWMFDRHAILQSWETYFYPEDHEGEDMLPFLFTSENEEYE
jgi:ABC-type transport system involved in multi-copper enzyme maturation permease subunit